MFQLAFRKHTRFAILAMNGSRCSHELPLSGIMARCIYAIHSMCTANSSEELIIVQGFAKSKLLLTGQVLENSFAVDPTAVKNPQAWVQSWTTVITTITKNSIAAPRIIISPLGNPDARGLKCGPSLLN